MPKVYFGNVWTHIFYSGYAPKVARKLLEAEGFEIEVWEVDDPSSRGHIAVIAKKSVGYGCAQQFNEREGETATFIKVARFLLACGYLISPHVNFAVVPSRIS
jgi:hypothetical protein